MAQETESLWGTKILKLLFSGVSDKIDKIDFKEKEKGQ